MSDISVFGDSVLKGVIYENNIYKVSKNRFSNICEDIYRKQSKIWEYNRYWKKYNI